MPAGRYFTNDSINHRQSYVRGLLATRKLFKDTLILDDQRARPGGKNLHYFLSAGSRYCVIIDTCFDKAEAPYVQFQFLAFHDRNCCNASDGGSFDVEGNLEGVIGHVFCGMIQSVGGTGHDQDEGQKELFHHHVSIFSASPFYTSLHLSSVRRGGRKAILFERNW